MNKEAHSFNYNYKTSSLHALNATMKKLCVFCSKTDFLCCILVFVPSKVCTYYF